jgi:hypothetical protein
LDDGLFTASEVAALKLDADWVVMSACNTAGSDTNDAEALSGLARAFFYAGARALLASHWLVNSFAATLLTSRTFAELRKVPRHAEPHRRQKGAVDRASLGLGTVRRSRRGRSRAVERVGTLAGKTRVHSTDPETLALIATRDVGGPLDV